jgi:hypothetical protein
MRARIASSEFLYVFAAFPSIERWSMRQVFDLLARQG